MYLRQNLRAPFKLRHCLLSIFAAGLAIALCGCLDETAASLMYGKVSNERHARGLYGQSRYPQVQKAAQLHAEWMCENGLRLMNIDRLLRDAGAPRYRPLVNIARMPMTSGEFFFYAKDPAATIQALRQGRVDNLHNTFMNSTPHRNNILGPSTLNGIGAAWCPDGMFYTAEIFVN